jgi:hypothetical protein
VAGFERLEDRALLSYTFSFNGTDTATVQQAAGSNNDSVYIVEVAGTGLEYSTDGVNFSSAWTGGTPPNGAAVTVNINEAAGATGDAIVIGTSGASQPASPISAILAKFTVNGTPSQSSLTLDDTLGSTPGTYSYDGTNFLAPGGFSLTNNAVQTAGVSIVGNPLSATYNVAATRAGEPVALDATGGTSVANVGIAPMSAANTLNAIHSQVSLQCLAGQATANLLDGGTTNSVPGTLGPAGAAGQFQVTGIGFGSGGSFAFQGEATPGGPGVNALNVDLGTSGSGGADFSIAGTPAGLSATINGGPGDDTLGVFATGPGSDVNIDGQGGSNTVTVGGNTAAVPGLQNLLGDSVNVSDATGTTALTIDDSGDFASQAPVITGSSTMFSGLAEITYDAPSTPGGDGVDALTIDGAGTQNDFTVNGTLANSLAPVDTTLYTGSGFSTVTVTQTEGPLHIHGQGQNFSDPVDLSDSGVVSGIAGPVSVDSSTGTMALMIDASSDPSSHDMTLEGGATGTVSGLSPGDVTYTTSDLSSLTIATGPAGHQVLTVDFTEGNPLPRSGPPGLQFNAGADATSAPGSHALNLQGMLPSGAFLSETHAAGAVAASGPPNSGGISFSQSGGAGPDISSGLTYSGLQPIDDTVPAINYSFEDGASPDPSFLAHDGPTVGGFQSIQFVSTPTPSSPPGYETTSVANKTNITFGIPQQFFSVVAGVRGVVDIPVASSGLATLTFGAITSGTNTISFVNSPPGVVTAYNGGPNDDATSVTGRGVPVGTTLDVDGGAGKNTLTYDAGGLVPKVTPLLPTGVSISLPGFGAVDAVNYQTIQIVNVGPLAINPGPAQPINSVEGFNYANLPVGTFTLPITPIIAAPAGLSASDFTASIDWGDPSPDVTAGTITQDASTPSVYDVTGSHTFVEQGTFTVTPSVAFSGGTISASVGGSTVSVSFGSLPTVPLAGDAATIGNGPIAVNVFPIVGTEGATIASGPIATFIDAGGVTPVSDYSVSLGVIDAGGLATSIPGAMIQQNSPGSAQYTVVAPDFSLPEEGAYQVVVTITDNDQPNPIAVRAASQAVIADAPLTAGAPVVAAGYSGLPTTVSSFVFHDDNTLAPASDFAVAIDWGDGSGLSTGTASQVGPAGTFEVTGTHTYVRLGVYLVTAVVTDTGGQKVTLNGTVRMSDLPPTGVPSTFSIQEGQSTGTIVLATITDPNPLATAGQLSAEVLNWGEGPLATPEPVAVVLVGGNAFGTVFQVMGSHMYLEEGTFPVTLAVTTLGGAATTFTPATGSADVVDAPLGASGSLSVGGIEGLGTGPKLIATFTDRNPSATVADFTTGTGSVVVDWGDNSAPDVLPASAITSAGTANGVLFSVTAGHTYAEAASYQVTVSINDTGGAKTVAHASAVITDAALGSAPVPTLMPETGLLLNNVVAAAFTDANTDAAAGDFMASIDWGDGTPVSIATVAATTTPGLFNALGTHAYARPGVFTTKTVVSDVDGRSITLPGMATVSDQPLMGQAFNFTAQEGQSTGPIALATITNPNTLAGLSQLTATVDWGDGTAPVTFTVPVSQTGGTTSGSLFQVTGSHTYAEEGSFTVKVLVTTTGGATTAPVSPLTATATVADAPLVAASSPSISGAEGASTGMKLIATFTDANPGATVGDFTTPFGSVDVSWGDGTPQVPLPTSAITAIGTPNGVLFQVTAAHTYLEAGSYQITVQASDGGGATTVAHASAAIADAPLSAPVQTPPSRDTSGLIITAGIAFKAVVATFNDASAMAPVSDFNYVTIDWGDGTPASSGTVVQPAGAGTTFEVLGTHTYAYAGASGSPGTFPTIVNLHDVDGSTLVIDNSIQVADFPIALAGALNPASDSGASNTDAITNVSRPNFSGTSEPFSDITLFATPTGGGAPVLQVGETEASSDGSWSIAASMLNDGSYTITARAVDQAGFTTGSVQLLPSATQGPLVIDTHGPKVTGLSFNRVKGQIDVTFQDDRSGMFAYGVQDAASYRLTKLNTKAGAYLVNVISQTQSGPTGPDNVVLTINNGRQLRGGTYTFSILSGAGVSGIRDIAGNALDGEFYGNFPSGNNITGGNFVAELDSIHNRVFAPRTTIGRASPVVPPGVPATGQTIPTANPTLPSGNPNFHVKASSLRNARVHVQRLAQTVRPASTMVHDAALAALTDRTHGGR